MYRRKMCDVIGQLLEIKKSTCRLYSMISCEWAWLNMATPRCVKLINFPCAIFYWTEVFSNHIYGKKLLNSMHPEMHYKLSADLLSLH